ncbi:MAG: hypothetical protein HY360_20875 [Verrucomicrobia bacterium]|nr:hypothetical protein [Verrucomicrobiota bacterium]
MSIIFQRSWFLITGLAACGLSAEAAATPELRQTHEIMSVATNLAVVNSAFAQTPTLTLRFWPRLDKGGWQPTREPRLNGKLLLDEPLTEGQFRISPSGDAVWQYVTGLAPYCSPTPLAKQHWQKIFHDPLTSPSQIQALIHHGVEPGYTAVSPIGYFREPAPEGGVLALVFDESPAGRRLTYRIPNFGEGLVQAIRAIYTGGSPVLKMVVSEDAAGLRPLLECPCPRGEGATVGGHLQPPRQGPLFLHFMSAGGPFTAISQITIETEVNFGPGFLPRWAPGTNTLAYSEAPSSSGRARLDVELVSKVVWEPGLPLIPGGKLAETLANGQRLPAPVIEIPWPGALTLSLPTPEDLAPYDSLCAEVRCDPGAVPPGARLLGVIDASGKVTYAPSYASGPNWFTIAIQIQDAFKHQLAKGVGIGGISRTDPPTNAAQRMLVRRVWLTKTPAPRSDHSLARLSAAKQYFLDRPLPSEKPLATTFSIQSLWRELLGQSKPVAKTPAPIPPSEDFWPWGIWMGWPSVCREFNVDRFTAVRAIYADLRRNGLNAVFMELPALSEAKRWVSQAEASGIRIWGQGPRYFVPPWTETSAREFYTPDMERALAETSRVLGHRRGILAYEFVEEIEESQVPLMTPYYALLKKYFPQQPGVIVHNSDLAFQADLRLNKPRIIACDHYPFRLGWSRRMINIYNERLTRNARAAAQSGTRWWLVAQSCYSVGGGPAGASYWGYTVSTPAKMLLQIWTGIGLGAKGVWFYGYGIPSIPLERLTDDLVFMQDHDPSLNAMEGSCFKNYDGSDTPQWLAVGRLIKQLAPHLPLLLKSRWTETDLAGTSSQELVRAYTHALDGCKDKLLFAVNEDWDAARPAALMLQGKYRAWRVRDLLAGRDLSPAELSTLRIPPGEGLLLLLQASK